MPSKRTSVEDMNEGKHLGLSSQEAGKSGARAGGNYRMFQNLLKTGGGLQTNNTVAVSQERRNLGMEGKRASVPFQVTKGIGIGPTKKIQNTGREEKKTACASIDVESAKIRLVWIVYKAYK